jgi:uncharacterized phage protein gp47/JayE
MSTCQGGQCTCGCCEGTGFPTPVSIANPPGQDALRYRVGTHSRFLESMLSGAATQSLLEALTTREPDDLAVGLMDSWASVLDVLTFYQERIANEGFLRTATERASLGWLASEVGYTPSPGAAANAWLAFQVETAPGAPAESLVPAGTKVQSLPGPNETPQVFETLADFTAKRSWVALRPQQREAYSIASTSTSLLLKGVSTNIQAGDGILLAGTDGSGNAAAVFRRVQQVTKDPAGASTTAVWDTPFGSAGFTPTEAYVLRTRAQLFGYNAPDWTAQPSSVQTAYKARHLASGASYENKTEWPGFTLAQAGTSYGNDNPAKTIWLDGLHPEIVINDWLVLTNGASVEVYKVASVADDSRTDYGLGAKCTKVGLTGADPTSKFGAALRQTVVWGQPELLPVDWTEPVAGDVTGSTLPLENAVSDLSIGQTLMIYEQQTGDLFPRQQEIAIIDAIDSSSGRTVLTLHAALKNRYSRQWTYLNANVILASHGENKTEVLGSGDGSAVYQSFTLKQKPLTYIQSDTPSGSATTLRVYVDDVEWGEVESLYSQSPKARVYVTTIADAGDVTVQFGNGIEGARLATGAENVQAVYRAGIGESGNVEAGQLSLLMTRPLGIKAVTNPEAASGGTDPESASAIRENAPLKVLTFDRIVSLEDYALYARAFTGVAKARSDLLWDGENRVVHVTVALNGGASFDPDSTLATNLNNSIRLYGDPFQPFVLKGCEQILFYVSAQVLEKQGYQFELVKAACIDALNASFGFEASALARSVTAGEVLAVLQRVDGVEAVELLAFGAMQQSVRLLSYWYRPPARPVADARTDAAPARWENGAMKPAQLIVLDPDWIYITEMNA